VVFVGESANATVRAVDVVADEAARARFRLVTPAGERDVRLGLHGVHHVGNALTATAVALEVGMDLDTVAGALEAARAVSRRRMEVTTRADGVTVVNDAYNANPESMRAALKSLATIARAGGGEPRRSWAVLGAMGELGDDEIARHDEIGRLAVRLDINRLVVVGEEAAPMHQGAHLEGSWGEESVLVPDVDAAIALLRDEVRPGDVVLVKASNMFGLWRVADALLMAGSPAGGAA
jgi:UDP-N-acetylmuramoyl-tripeptide--D-alanyl-D-alanine ligase